MMENNKLNVLDQVIQERSSLPEYPDEILFSNVYYASLSTRLRAIGGFSGEEKNKRQNANEWIHEKSHKACAVRAINFDRVADLLNNGSTSCDAFFYNFCHNNNEFHFISEFKNTENAGKQELLRLLKREDNDGIYRKVKDSVESIRHNLLFGGNQEADDIIRNMHFLWYTTEKTMQQPQLNLSFLQKSMRHEMYTESRIEQHEADSMNIHQRKRMRFINGLD